MADAGVAYYEWQPSDVVRHRDAHVSRLQDGSTHRVNEYEIGPLVGSGAFAQVFRAMAPDPHRNGAPATYAVKVINKRALEKKRAWKKAGTGNNKRSAPQLVSLFDRVLTELDVWESLRCRNIVALVEVMDNAQDPSMYLVAEFARHGQIMVWQPASLRYTCPRIDEGTGPLPHELARHYFRDVVAAVHYLHGCNIIHRDIKPENILVAHHHVCKLCDLGEAEAIKDPKRNPRGLVSETRGTYQFFPPECCVAVPGAAALDDGDGESGGGSVGGGGDDDDDDGDYDDYDKDSDDDLDEDGGEGSSGRESHNDDADPSGGGGGGGASKKGGARGAAAAAAAAAAAVVADGGASGGAASPAAFGVDVPPFSGYAADMWAVGVSLFACVFGFLPFYSDSTPELFSLIGALLLSAAP
jgi:serine/threonine protein kinase